jgi:hypothetical protein
MTVYSLVMFHETTTEESGVNLWSGPRLGHNPRTDIPDHLRNILHAKQNGLKRDCSLLQSLFSVH